MIARVGVLALLSSGAMCCSPLQQIQRIVAFGDEWSDLGNTAAVVPEGTAPRISGYYQNSHFSNAQNWQELLNGFSPGGGVGSWAIATPTPGRDGTVAGATAATSGTAWAWGGAMSGSGAATIDGLTIQVPNVRTQVANFLASAPNPIQNSTLYVLQSFTGLTSAAGASAANDLVDAARALSSAGAQHVVIVTPPAFGNAAALQKFDAAYGAAVASGVSNRIRELGLSSDVMVADFYGATAAIASVVNGGGSWTPDFPVPAPVPTITDITTIAAPNAALSGNFWWGANSGTTAAHRVLAGVLSLQVARAVACPSSLNGTFGWMREPAAALRQDGMNGINGELFVSGADVSTDASQAMQMNNVQLMNINVRIRESEEWYGYVVRAHMYIGTTLWAETTIDKLVAHEDDGFRVGGAVWVDTRVTRIEVEVRRLCFDLFTRTFEGSDVITIAPEGFDEDCVRVVSRGQVPDPDAAAVVGDGSSSKKGLLGLLGLLGLIPLCLCLLCIIWMLMKKKKQPPAEGTIASTYESDYTDPEPIPEANVHYHPIVPAYPHAHVEHVEVPYHHNPAIQVAPTAVTPGYYPTQTSMVQSYGAAPQAISYGGMQ